MRHRVVSQASWTHVRIKGAALIVPLHWCNFMAEMSQDGKEQILAGAAQSTLLR